MTRSAVYLALALVTGAPLSSVDALAQSEALSKAEPLDQAQPAVADNAARAGETGRDKAIEATFVRKQNGSADNITINPTTHGYAWAEPFIAGMEGYAANTAGGTAWKTQGHGNWNIFQSVQPLNPTELQVYTSAAMGIAQTVAGTNKLTLISGSTFDTTWIGRIGFFWSGNGYRVTAVNGSTLAVTNMDGSAVSWRTQSTDTFYFVATTVDNKCRVSGRIVTYQSGQPFINWFNRFTINGTRYNATFIDPNHMRLPTTLDTISQATCHEDANINNELSVLRLQGLAGANEENFAVTERPDGTYLQSTYAGLGKYRPIHIGTGENPAGTFKAMANLYPAAKIGEPSILLLGGDSNTEVLNIPSNPNNVNYFYVQGGAPGVAATISARGADKDTTMGLDVQGAGNFVFTAGAFSKTVFKVYGTSGSKEASYLGVAPSAAGNPKLLAQGSEANINVVIQPKGAGAVQTAGPVQLASSTVAALPACTPAIQNSIMAITDAVAPTWHAAPIGGGSMHVLAFCDGSTWTVH